ncbi:hypothetical protein DSM14862_03805 (plasmid) [Sulfitobacter indolifex]|uniref:Gamma-glutamyltransferase n=1 Tax=Sulfitobacter indolifex HEL-45 TaxID=391624 RepID=A0ABM9X0M2_9RHOB|nr:gamma-glutamyltransferase [Sulfitobacter indolifex]EDQ03003.1 hypothetical protein OIHEL45_19731 [Sulfitobacter indolifex HEL-45]UOA20966.1 hypothetical protein DSM14862_03805 [Sulfitobacter indolifex]
MHFTHNPVDVSRRAPVRVENIVSTAQPLAPHAGLSILQRRGTAVDAAISAAAALAIADSTKGLGADAFCNLWSDPHLRRLPNVGYAAGLELRKDSQTAGF